MEETKRKLFKFYRSYFDVYNELNKANKLLFIDALLRKQFLGIDPELKGMTNFAYMSQKHSIDKQVKGWEDKMQIKLHPAQGGDLGGDVQEEEKVKEEVKEKVIYPFNTENFIKFWDLWKRYKKEEHRFTYKSYISEQAALKKLGKDSDNNELTAIQMIEYSIANGYKGLFKEHKNKIKQNGATIEELTEITHQNFGKKD